MIRFVFIAAFCFSVIGAANAGPAPAHDLSNVKCEDPHVIAFIRSSLPGMHAATNGSSIMQVLSDNSELTATTVYARKDSFACHIRLNMQFGRGTQAVAGKFTYREFPGGKHRVEFLPNY